MVTTLLKIMANKYSNFVKPSSSPGAAVTSTSSIPINGEVAKKLYLEEVKEVREFTPATDDELRRSSDRLNQKRKGESSDAQLSDKDLFLAIENDEVDTLKMALDTFPDKINVQDDYGWSLLMIACQANSAEVAKELLKRNIDTTIRDKAGNSAQSLVIKNKNLVLADLLLSHRSKTVVTKTKTTNSSTSRITKPKTGSQTKKARPKEFTCEICDNQYSDRTAHLSSTLHNINASKGKKVLPNFKIPQSNRGYQIMVKVGWDRESGLGPEGSGLKYPIKTVQKKDRKGLGLEKKKEEKEDTVSVRQMNRRTLARNDFRNRRLEADFRRQFY